MRELPAKAIGGSATCADVIKCLFNLSDNEVAIYRSLLKKGPKRSDELEQLLNKDRTTVYRALQKLISCGFVFRETKTIAKKGGFYHVYGATPAKKIKEQAERCIDEWHKNMHDAIEKFEQSL